MSGWKARIGYLSPSVFESPSDWDLILPKGFTIVSSGLNVQAHTTEEFDKAIDALGAGLGIFKAEECDAILMGGITLGTQRGYGAEQELVAQLSKQVGLPVSSAMSATVEALKHLKVRTTVIATAYKENINQGRKKILRRRWCQSPRHQRPGCLQAGGSSQTTGLRILQSRPRTLPPAPRCREFADPGPLALGRLCAGTGRRYTTTGSFEHRRLALVGLARARDETAHRGLRKTAAGVNSSAMDYGEQTTTAASPAKRQLKEILVAHMLLTCNHSRRARRISAAGRLGPLPNSTRRTETGLVPHGMADRTTDMDRFINAYGTGTRAGD